jgi:signal transduction histidine kinase
MASTVTSAWSDKLRGMGVTPPTNRRVLVVDDEQPNLDVLTVLLEDEFEVHTAASGPEAQRVIASVGPMAVVLADQRMPGMTGVELLADISRRMPDTVRMVLTAYSDIGPIIGAVNEGRAYRFILKPWDADEMRAAVRDGVYLHEARLCVQHLVELQARRRDELSATLDKLRRSEQELLASERMSTLGRFTSGITHNIRNSLTVMMNLLEIVQQSPGEAEVLRAAQTAFQSLDALLRLVGDVNALARGELGTAQAALVECAPFLEQTLNLFRLEGAGKGRTVRSDIEPGARVLRFDPARVRQALLALLRNAAQASDRGSPLEVSVRLEAGKRRACLEVRDRGRGMPQALAEDASRPYGAPSDTPVAALGIGLELVRVVAAAHGGRLLMLSSRGSGTTAQLWLTDAAPEELLDP